MVYVGLSTPPLAGAPWRNVDHVNAVHGIENLNRQDGSSPARDAGTGETAGHLGVLLRNSVFEIGSTRTPPTASGDCHVRITNRSMPLATQMNLLPITAHSQKASYCAAILTET